MVNAIRSLWQDLTHPAIAVHVDPTARYQTLEGWGTSLAWWGHALGRWPDARRSAIADLVFSPTAGLGLNIVRYNIGGGDDPAHHHLRPGGDVPGYQPAQGTWDWTADAAQRQLLQDARERGATLCEAFANAPPYWMTRSGCAAGATDGGDNLRDDCVDLFAAYLAEVVVHFRDAWGLTFRTVEPFNEPAASNWRSGNRQEGCHVSLDQQRAVIARLAVHLRTRGLTATAISAADDYNVDQTVTTVGSYDPATLAAIAQVNTHSYEGTRRADLRALAESHGKRLWMSEYGTGGGAHDHDAMAPALRLSDQIRRDLTELRPSAWVYWQAVEHEQNNNWGFIHADFNGAGAAYWPTKQYYAMGQYSRFMRPGYTIVGADDPRALAAYDEAAATLVLVRDNPDVQEARSAVDLSRFARLGATATAYRTSPAENLAPLPELPLSGKTLVAALPAQSITTFVITDATVS